MRNRNRVLIVIGVIILAGAAYGGWRYESANPQAVPKAVGEISTAVAPPSAAGPLVVSGFIEADEIQVAAPVGGRITLLPVEEGQEVISGSQVVQLDSSVAAANLAVAQAKVAAAQAALAQVKAGPRAEIVAQAQAAVMLAEAYRDQAHQSWQDAKMLVSQQQTLDLQLTQAQGQVAADQAKLAAATANKNAVEIAKDKVDQDLAAASKKGYSTPGNPLLNQWWRSWVGLNAADATYQGALSLVNTLQAQRNNPVDQVAQMHAADAAYHASLAAVSQAQARLKDVQAGATVEQVNAAAAQVAVAEAQAAADQTDLQKLTIVAPANGLVLQRTVYTGEVAAPGATLLTLADLDSVSLVVYLPESKLNLARLGQAVDVHVDSFPNRAFSGQVVHIADQADFIPDKVQSTEDRIALVFAVKISLPNAGHLLKPGMPADVTLGSK
jgi:HlyD family secretion protein